MNGQSFLLFMKHFVTHVRCTSQRPALLLRDNHESHINLEILDFAKANGVIMLSIPPHSSHKLLPLDRSVYFPFKKFFNTACDAWMNAIKGKTMTIYDIPSCLRYAFPLAMTMKNMCAGFIVSGICPFNRETFSDVEYMPLKVTHRLEPAVTMVRFEVPDLATTSQELPVFCYW
ncbi:uncharacterized protein LOC136088257 [Hydra vulgaris]|uniref:Uncharacterized protein LOC136088257 n=1 Tax=Hydra vulgaris TaxID=6087 RepID=A0ABM4D1A3_HYDVU